MTAPLLAAVAASLTVAGLLRSRERRARRHRIAAQRRRAARERQWRAMIRDVGRDG